MEERLEGIVIGWCNVSRVGRRSYIRTSEATRRAVRRIARSIPGASPNLEESDGFPPSICRDIPRRLFSPYARRLSPATIRSARTGTTAPITGVSSSRKIVFSSIFIARSPPSPASCSPACCLAPWSFSNRGRARRTALPALPSRPGQARR